MKHSAVKNWFQFGDNANKGALIILTLSIVAPLFAQDTTKTVTVFANVRIFDGKSDKLSAPSYVLVRGNLIEKISTTPIPTDRQPGATVIDGGGRTLMPGLIDAHWHAMLAATPISVLLTAGDGYINLLAASE